MTRLEALRDLKMLVEEDDPPNTWRVPLNADLIETALADDDVHWSNFQGAYSGSLTDAIALAEGMMKGVDWNVWTCVPIGQEYAVRLLWPMMNGGEVRALAYAPTPARAMLLAVLDALIEKEAEE